MVKNFFNTPILRYFVIVYDLCRKYFPSQLTTVFIITEYKSLTVSVGMEVVVVGIGSRR